MMLNSGICTQIVQKKYVKCFAHISKLVEVRCAIEAEDTMKSKNLGYMTRTMVIVTLPHSKPKEHFFQRTNGDFTMTMIGNPNFGLSYGLLPRLLLAWMTPEAKIKNSPMLHLERSFSSFLNLLKLSKSGGQRGDATRLRDQLPRLFSTHISCVYQNNKKGVCKAEQFIVAKSFNLWWNPIREEKDRILSQSTIVFAKDFFKEIINRSVPVDFRMLQVFRRSPLQMGSYVWLTYRFSYLKISSLIHWSLLSNQFGSNYASTPQGLIDYKREFLKALRVVTVMYQDAKIEIQDDGLLLKPTKSHFSRRKNMGDA